MYTWSRRDEKRVRVSGTCKDERLGVSFQIVVIRMIMKELQMDTNCISAS